MFIVVYHLGASHYFVSLYTPLSLTPSLVNIRNILTRVCSLWYTTWARPTTLSHSILPCHSPLPWLTLGIYLLMYVHCGIPLSRVPLSCPTCHASLSSSWPLTRFLGKLRDIPRWEGGGGTDSLGLGTDCGIYPPPPPQFLRILTTSDLPSINYRPPFL